MADLEFARSDASAPPGLWLLANVYVRPGLPDLDGVGACVRAGCAPARDPTGALNAEYFC